MPTGLTPQLPLNFAGEGDFALIKRYEQLIKQNLKNLVLTVPGEKPMDSNFGVGIQRFLFEPNLSYVYGDMKTEIRSQVSQYMPFLTVGSINVSADKQNKNVARVQISYVIDPLDVEDNLSLIIDDVLFT